MKKLPSLIGDTWFNTSPLSSADYSDKAVLIDFWTYTSADCRRTLPYLKTWWERYRDLGLVMIGVHAPQFNFEKNENNVKQVIKDFGISWPVVMDNDLKNWHNFSNQSWPTKYLADRKGNIIYSHLGEGNYAETEQIIQGLVATCNPDKKLPKINNNLHKHKRTCSRATPQLHCGHARGSIVNKEGIRVGEVFRYSDPSKLPEDSIGLAGEWYMAEEYAVSSGANAKLLLNFEATEVNVVLGPEAKPLKLNIQLNNKAIPKKISGDDVTASSQLEVNRSGMYNVLKAKSKVKGTLLIEAKANGVKAYAFTFTGCKE